MEKEQVERLYRQQYQRMLSMDRSLVYDDEEARDVVSEVFASLLDASLTGDDNIVGYLSVCVRHRCLDLLAHKDVRSRFEQAYTQEAPDAVTPAEDDERLALLLAFMQRDHTLGLRLPRTTSGWPCCWRSCSATTRWACRETWEAV